MLAMCAEHGGTVWPVKAANTIYFGMLWCFRRGEHIFYGQDDGVAHVG
jgi:hypothetical protein